MAGIMPLLDPFARGDPRGSTRGRCWSNGCRAASAEPLRDDACGGLRSLAGAQVDRHRRDASRTDGRTTDTPRGEDTIAAGLESTKPQVNGDVGGARGGTRTPDLPITSRRHYAL